MNAETIRTPYIVMEPLTAGDIDYAAKYAQDQQEAKTLLTTRLYAGWVVYCGGQRCGVVAIIDRGSGLYSLDGYRDRTIRLSLPYSPSIEAGNAAISWAKKSGLKELYAGYIGINRALSMFAKRLGFISLGDVAGLSLYRRIL